MPKTDSHKDIQPTTSSEVTFERFKQFSTLPSGLSKFVAKDLLGTPLEDIDPIYKDKQVHTEKKTIWCNYYSMTSSLLFEKLTMTAIHLKFLTIALHKFFFLLSTNSRTQTIPNNVAKINKSLRQFVADKIWSTPIIIAGSFLIPFFEYLVSFFFLWFIHRFLFSFI